jgi:hypothetical protein
MRALWCSGNDRDDADAIDIYECPLCAGDEVRYEDAMRRAKAKKRRDKSAQQKLRKERRQRRSVLSLVLMERGCDGWVLVDV